MDVSIEGPLSAADANELAVRLFGTGAQVEEREGGFVVWQVPEVGQAQGGPDGVALPAREIIGTGPTREAAIESARHALHRD